MEPVTFVSFLDGASPASFRRSSTVTPHAEDDGHEEQLHEPVTGMDGREHQRHVLVNDGAQKDHGRENPYQGAKTHGTSPVDDSKTHNKVREHKRDDEALNNHE